MNKVILMGYVGKTPEERKAGELAVLSFPLATSKWNAKEKAAATTWHRVVVMGKVAESTAGKITKGSRVLVEGEYLGRKYQDKEGKEQYIMEVVTWAPLTVIETKQQEQAAEDQGGGW